MTVHEARDTAAELARVATWRPPAASRDLLAKAAEAIGFLLDELERADAELDDMENC